MRFLFLLFLSFTLLLAETSVFSELNESNQTKIEKKITSKLLYQSYFELPKKLLRGQVFPLTIKTLSTNANTEDIIYEFENEIGLKILSDEKSRQFKDPYFYDTFYMQVTGNYVKTPRIISSVIFKDYDGGYEEKFDGVKIKVLNLNPKKDFSGILANQFKITKYKTTQYDNENNIIVFSAEANMGNIHEFTLKDAIKEDIDSFEENFPYSSFTYYAVVPKQLKELKFTYFNLMTNRFQKVIVPIIVNNDRVSTQTDLAPTQNTHVIAKIIVYAVISILGILLFVTRRKKFYLLIAIIPLFFVAKLLIPIKHVCVKEDSNIYLLPMNNGTIFEQTAYRFTTEELGKVEKFTKIRMQNQQIGWVKNENICKD